MWLLGILWVGLKRWYNRRWYPGADERRHLGKRVIGAVGLSLGVLLFVEGAFHTTRSWRTDFEGGIVFALVGLAFYATASFLTHREDARRALERELKAEQQRDAETFKGFGHVPDDW